MNNRGILSIFSFLILALALAIPADAAAQTDVDKCVAIFDEAIADMDKATTDAQMNELSENIDKQLVAFENSEQALTKDDTKRLNNCVRKMMDGMMKKMLRLYNITDPTMIGAADEEMQKQMKLILNQVKGSSTLGEYVTKLHKALS